MEKKQETKQTRKQYIRPETDTIRVEGEQLMEWFSTNISDEPIDDDDIFAKPGFFDDIEEETPHYHYNLWDD